MIELTLETKIRIDTLFIGDERNIVAEKLTLECGDNLPLVDTSYIDLAERIRFAVLKLSRGDIKKLDKAISDAAVDWRDVLMVTWSSISLQPS